MFLHSYSVLYLIFMHQPALLFIAVGIYSYYLGDFQPIDALNDRERFLQVYTMDFLIFNAVLQKVMISLMIVTVFIFTFGLNKLIKDGQ